MQFPLTTVIFMPSWNCPCHVNWTATTFWYSWMDFEFILFLKSSHLQSTSQGGPFGLCSSNLVPENIPVFQFLGLFNGAFTTYLLCLHMCAQSGLTLCDPMDCSLPGSSVHVILQARILEWVAVSFSRDRTWISCIAGRFFFMIWITKEAKALSIHTYTQNGNRKNPNNSNNKN